MPEWVIWVLVGLGLFIAGGLTYHDLRKKHGSDEKRQETVDVLGRQLPKGNNFFHALENEEDYQEWLKDVNLWVEETEALIAGGLTQVEVSLFLSPSSSGGTFQFDVRRNREHNTVLNKLQRMLDALTEIITRNSSH